jgi:hypothetical protein
MNALQYAGLLQIQQYILAPRAVDAYYWFLPPVCGLYCLHAHGYINFQELSILLGQAAMGRGTQLFSISNIYIESKWAC